MPQRISWSREELLVAFRLYCSAPFGKLHQHNPAIIKLAKLFRRTPSAVAMKACNFASLDPTQQARQIKGLSNASKADRSLWEEFEQNSEAVAAKAEAAYERIAAGTTVIGVEEFELPTGPTEITRNIRVRRVQRFFRSAVLNTYDFRCALTDISVPGLLNASHIIPWSDNEHRRADPRNGLCLNALHDRAFDRGLITFDENWRLMISPQLRIKDAPVVHRRALLELEGHALRLPERFKPDPEAMTHHRERRFIGAA